VYCGTLLFTLLGQDCDETLANQPSGGSMLNFMLKFVSQLSRPLARHLGALALLGLAACSSPHKAKDIETKLDKGETISGDTQLGIKNGNLVVQKKVMMNEDLRRLQNEVYSLEDRVYGNRDYKSEGLYGTLKKCRAQTVSRKFGGDGKLIWTEPMDRVTDKEDSFEIGIDEKEKIVGISEEFLKDRIERFRNYKLVLMKREDEYKEKIEVCDAELDAKMHDLKEREEEKREAKKTANAAGG
jgi:hypothetical protein